MTITINTSVQNFDPSGTCNDAQLRDSISAYGTAAVAAMEKAFPGSEVDHNVIEGDVSRSIEISYDETQNHDDALFEAQRVIEAVYETGTFWA